MGILILPILLGAMGVAIFAIQQTIKLLIKKEIRFNEIFFGLIISTSIFGLICVSYLIEGRAWELSPAFRIPFFMIFLPYVFYEITKPSKNKTLKHYATLVLISIGLTGILAVAFHNLLFNLIDILGIEKHF